MTVVCYKCKSECEDYSFVNIGTDIRPVCKHCTRREKVMKELVIVHEERLERAWNNKDNVLSNWLR